MENSGSTSRLNMLFRGGGIFVFKTLALSGSPIREKLEPACYPALFGFPNKSNSGVYPRCESATVWPLQS